MQLDEDIQRILEGEAHRGSISLIEARQPFFLGP